MRRSNRFNAPAVAAATVLAGAGLASPSAGLAHVTDEFHLVEQSVVVDRTGGTATFRLSFDREPRFFLPHGGGGDQPDGFQIEIDADSNTLEQPLAFEDIDTVVRGAEIFAGDGIPVRDREGDGGNNAGGWGPVRALVPFDLDGSTLTFTTGLETLGDEDGRFRYRLITTQSGGLTGEVNAAIIPTPMSVWGGMVLLGAGGLAVRLRKRFC